MEIKDSHLLEGDGITHLNCSKNKIKFTPGDLDTIVIHYTAGSSAASSANYLCKKDLLASAHLVIGREGEVYQLVPFDTIAWHAGRSMYAGRKGLNQFSIGIELDNAGELKRSGSEYQSSFNRRYQENDVVTAPHRNDVTQKNRYWHSYTEKQVEKCREVCEMLIAKYKINTIVGHEEIAPGRKLDPGPAFALDKFRNDLLTQNRSDEIDTVNKTGEVVASSLNIREDAGVTFKKVAMPLLNGKKVKIMEERDGWYRVETTIEGWVSKGHIKVD